MISTSSFISTDIFVSSPKIVFGFCAVSRALVFSNFPVQEAAEKADDAKKQALTHTQCKVFAAHKLVTLLS